MTTLLGGHKTEQLALFTPPPRFLSARLLQLGQRFFFILRGAPLAPRVAVAILMRGEGIFALLDEVVRHLTHGWAPG
jgi:hypothetical protein